MTDRAYARISLDTERSGSIVKQRARLLKLADDPSWYVDESVSGAKVPFAERPAGARLLADLRKDDRVLVTRIDRAARNVRDLLGLVERIEAAGASIVFVDQNIDTAGPMGRFLLTLLGAVAELEAAIVAERVRETRESFRAEGRWGGGPVPFGFMTAPHPRGRGLVLRPDPDTAATARDVVARVVNGEAQRALAPLVGLKESGFSRWLRSPSLAGIRTGGTELEIDPDAAILSLSEWQGLQDYLDRPAKAWTRADGYGEALVCGVCGHRLYYARNKRYPDSSVYRCGRRAHADGDPAVAVTRRLADAHIETDFLTRFGSEKVLEEVTVTASAVRDEALAVARLRLEAAQRAQREARDRDSRRTAHAAVDAALDALDEAEALPDETVVETRDTGMTHAELWEMLPPGERSAFIASAGRWSVAPGRGLPVDQKMTFVATR